MPSWEDIVCAMYDKQLDGFSGDVAQVIYSKDRSWRYVVLRDDKGLLTWQLEKLYPYDEDEWQYIALERNAPVGMWMPFAGSDRHSVFADLQALKNELQSESVYKQYF